MSARQDKVHNTKQCVLKLHPSLLSSCVIIYTCRGLWIKVLSPYLLQSLCLGFERHLNSSTNKSQQVMPNGEGEMSFPNPTLTTPISVMLKAFSKTSISLSLEKGNICYCQNISQPTKFKGRPSTCFFEVFLSMADHIQKSNPNPALIPTATRRVSFPRFPRIWEKAPQEHLLWQRAAALFCARKAAS